VITKDNVTMRVDAVVYARVEEPVPAVVKVQNYLFAVSQSTQTNPQHQADPRQLER
jgi:regulator of protease activity HflC (stomatin/prohibitin superfamily)